MPSAKAISAFPLGWGSGTVTHRLLGSRASTVGSRSEEGHALAFDDRPYLRRDVVERIGFQLAHFGDVEHHQGAAPSLRARRGGKLPRSLSGWAIQPGALAS